MSEILSPEEIAKRQQENRSPRPTRVKKESRQFIDHDEDEPQEIQSDNLIPMSRNRSGKVQVNFETSGRFGIPETLWFEDYDTTHINDLSLCNEDNILETLVSILSDINENEEGERINIEDMTLEEFLESMIAIKMTFDTPNHIHRWVCDCQSGKERDDIEINEEIIDLRTLNYVNIAEADDKLREFYKEIFDSMTNTEFQDYLYMKYKFDPIDDIESHTREDEVKTVHIKEPIRQNINEKLYSFRFMRVRDMLEAKKIIDRKYAYKIKQINSKKVKQGDMGNLEEFQAKKQQDIKDLEYQKAKDTLLYAQASTIVEIDGKPVNDIEEKVKLYKAIKRSSLLEFMDFMDRLTFGISDEKELVCPSCGKTSKRLLRKEFNPHEFIPIQLGSDDRIRSTSRGNIFM